MSNKLIISIIINVLLGFAILFLLYKSGKVHQWLGFDLPKSTTYEIKAEILAGIELNEQSIVIIGNSLVEFCDWNELLDTNGIINLGISQETTDGLLVRLKDVVKQSPKQIIIAIGTNDIRNGKSAKYLKGQYQQMINLIKTNSPLTKITFISILPARSKSRTPEIILETNKELKQLCNVYDIGYVNLFKYFADDSNMLKNELSSDGLHINYVGYEIWAAELKMYISN